MLDRQYVYQHFQFNVKFSPSNILLSWSLQQHVNLQTRKRGTLKLQILLLKFGGAWWRQLISISKLWNRRWGCDFFLSAYLSHANGAHVEFIREIFTHDRHMEDPNRTPFMAITAHWIQDVKSGDMNGEQSMLHLRADLVGFIHLPGHHTGEHMAQALLHSTDRLNITKKVREKSFEVWTIMIKSILPDWKGDNGQRIQ